LFDNVIRLAQRSGKFLWQRLPTIWWALLLAIHSPIFVLAIVSLIRERFEPSGLGNVIALAISLAFFALKLWDVPWLRLRTRQQAFITTCVLTAIVHHGAIVSEFDQPLALPATVAVATVAVVSCIVRRRSALLTGWRERLAALLARRIVHSIAAWQEGSDRSAAIPEVLLYITIPRAPPA
jgi:hypothetical protein